MSSERRRKLLKGVIAAPVLVTLPAGANVARTSASCEDKAASYDEQGRLSVSCWSSIGGSNFDPQRAAEQAEELFRRIQ